jgi:hypothetical protein
MNGGILMAIFVLYVALAAIVAVATLLRGTTYLIFAAIVLTCVVVGGARLIGGV